MKNKIIKHLVWSVIKNQYFFLFLFFCSNVEAQNPSPKLNKKIEGLRNLKAIMKEVDSYYEDEEREKEREQRRNKRAGITTTQEGEEEFESELLHWKRWEYWNQTRLKENGDLEDVAAKTIAAYDAVDAKYGKINSGTNAQWNFVGPWNNSYQAGFYRGLSKGDRIVFHPSNQNVFYVCCLNGGVWKTSDGGSSWICITFNLPIQSVSGITIDPFDANHLYVITGDNKGGNGISQNSCGIWVTYDNGGNWFKTSFNNDAQSSIYNGYKIVMLPDFTNVIFAATQNGLYRSTDGGITWGSPIIGGPIFDVEINPSNTAIVYASSANRLYRSVNYGASFPANEQTSFSGANRIEIGVSPNNSNYVYLLCGPYGGGVGTNTFRGIYRSTTSGSQNSFTLRANTPNILCDATNGIVSASDAGDQSGYDLAIDVDKSNAETIVVAGKIVWKSTNGGTTLTNLTPYNEGNQNAVPPANYIHPDIQDIGFNPLNNFLYACTDGGVYRSTNGGSIWTDITNGIHATTFFHMANAPFDANRIIGGTQDNGVKYKKDAGEFAHITGADGFDCSFGPSSSSSVYTTINNVFGRFSSTGVAESFNTPANTSFFPTIAADPVTNNVVYLASGGGGIQKSINGGNTWSQVSALTVRQSINISPANSSRIYVVGVGSIYRSDNGGSTWSANLASNPGFPVTSSITDIFACTGNSDFVYVSVGGYTANRKVFYSNDAGANWINISGTLPADVNIRCVVADIGNNAYIGTDVGVFYQAVYSSDWTPHYNGIPRCPITDLAIHQGSSKLRASTYGHGIWETALFTTCDPNYLLSGYVAGPKFYQVSNTLTVNASIVGGNSTKVFAQAGNRIVLSNGFRAYSENYFKASIRNCESGPPTSSENNEKNVPVFVYNVDKGDSTTLYRFGSLSADYSLKNKVSLNIQIVKTGVYRLVLSDKKDTEISIVFKEEFGENQLITKEIAGLKSGKHFVKLYFGEVLAHFQEIIIN